MDSDEIVINGISAETGDPACPTLTAGRLAKAIRDAFREGRLQAGLPKSPSTGGGYPGLISGTQSKLGYVAPHAPWDPENTGWGIVMATDQPGADEILDALSPLLELRKSQFGKCYHEFCKGARGYSRNKGWKAFLDDHCGGPGAGADPKKCPLYMLVVGSPAFVPFDAQYNLDHTLNVGRIDFDAPQQYGNYANAVVAHESRLSSNPSRIVFFGSHHQREDQDRAPALAQEELVSLLVQELRALKGQKNSGAGLAEIDWKRREDCSKDLLKSLLGGSDTPDILFSVTHGADFSRGSKHQKERQGALLCSDWDGEPLVDSRGGPLGKPPWGGCVSGRDVDEQAELSGLIAFLFACHSAGTPQEDQYASLIYGKSNPVADEPFVTCLPKALLGIERGALAVIGHVERVWAHSFRSASGKPQVKPFQDFLEMLMDGFPVGDALQPFSPVWKAKESEEAEALSEYLRVVLAALGSGSTAAAATTAEDDERLVDAFVRSNDARNWILLGDPAVRLRSARHPGKAGLFQWPGAVNL